MEAAVIKNVLVEQLDANKDGSLFSIPDKTSVSLLIQTTEGIMPITDVEEVEFGDRYVAVTAEEERLFVEKETLFGIREDDLDQKNPDKRPGFH